MQSNTLFALLLSLIVPAGSAPADMCFNFENCYNTNDPFTLFVYVDQSIKLRRQSLRHANFVYAQASLGSFFFMRTGTRIRDFRKRCTAKYQYDPLMAQYASYCREFLYLSEPVTLAAVRETKKFLISIVSDIHDIVLETQAVRTSMRLE